MEPHGDLVRENLLLFMVENQGVATWAIGSIVFVTTGHLGIFGLGYDDLSSGLSLNLTWKIAGVLLFSKL